MNNMCVSGVMHHIECLGKLLSTWNKTGGEKDSSGPMTW